MSIYAIGVDVGNNDTKTKHTSTVSGYTAYTSEQLLADKVLFYDGMYYVESMDERFPYVEDKRIKDQALILTLFAIAKEIIWRVENEQHLAGNLQSAISAINTIQLAVGLPPGHFNKYAKDIMAYYKAAMDKGISFNYAGYKFAFKTSRVRVYAQALTAVLTANNLTVTDPENGSSKFYTIDIGGQTVDIFTLNNMIPEVDNCRSLSMGTRPMYETIIARIQASCGITLDERAVEDVLMGKRSFIGDDVKDEIRRNAALHADQIIDRCIQAGFALDRFPVVFNGGGACLLHDQLKANKKICYCEFIDSPKANAASFEDCLIIDLKQSQTGGSHGN